MTSLLPSAPMAARSAVLAVALCLSSSLLADPGDYEVTNLVADLPGVAANMDGNLKNGWGIAFGTTNPVWVSDNETGKSTIYDGAGTPQALVVTIPAVNGVDQGTPTGMVFNPGASAKPNDFLIAGPGTAAVFLWATEDGGIAAWASGNVATIKFAAADGASYKGLAMAADGDSHFRLYGADFHNGKIDVIDSTFSKLDMAGAFEDPAIPAGFAPFNVVNIQGNLYVAYAMREPDGDDEVAGPGLGYVDVFDHDGELIARVATRGKLDAPWGMALAPADFGKFSNHLLVGNFGDGTINAYDPKNFTFAGQLRTTGHALKIDGLWGIAFGNGFRGQPTNALFFAAGPNEESNGLYGVIVPAP